MPRPAIPFFTAVTAVALLLAACSGGSPAVTPTAALSATATVRRGPDQDAIELAGIAGTAVKKAQEIIPSAVLHQVDVGPVTRTLVFRFTDAAATEELTMTASSPDLPPDRWKVDRGASPLVGTKEPGIDLQAWRTGPGAVTRAAQAQWPGCRVADLAFLSFNGDLTWVVFCDLPSGTVSGTLDNRTGVFKANPAPPAPQPLTATPKPPASATPTPTPSPVPTPTQPPTATPVPSPSPIPFPPTPSPTPRPTVTPIPTVTPTPIGPTVSVGNAAFLVETAVDDQQKARGLSGRDILHQGSGMIFLYTREDTYGFWMKGMRFPLDFVWIAGNCSVLEITPNVPQAPPGAPDSSLPIYYASRPVLHVLEINAGEAARQGVRAGDQVGFSGAALAGYRC